MRYEDRGKKIKILAFFYPLASSLRFPKDGSMIWDEGPRTVLCSSNRSSPAKRNWHREAILACVSRLAKAKPLLAAECSSLSQEHTPRQQEYAATPLPEGISDQKRLAAF